jgi:hypothetical protein
MISSRNKTLHYTLNEGSIFREQMMGLHRENEFQTFIDYEQDDASEVTHKKHIRKQLEKRMEQKRLKEELEFFDGELDGEFDWDYVDK